MTINVLEYLERAAARFPEKVAFGDQNRRVTYRELLQEAKGLGTALAGYGFRRQPVVVVTNHTVECLITFLGIVYSGNFYVPVDAKLPAARIQAILDVTQTNLVLVPRQDAEKFAEFTQPDKLVIREEIPRDQIDEEELAKIRGAHLDVDPLYLMFTSGSTGVPKGVLICHRSVIDLAEQFALTFGFQEKDVFANQAPFDFDVSVKDIYCTLRNAASLYIVPQSMFSMPKALIPYLNENRVTTIIWAVSALSILSAMKVLEKELPQYLKRIMFSGEVMPGKVLNDWRSHLPDAMFVNLYGPTEITCNCTYYILDRDFSAQEDLPIGYAFRNTEILLLDERNNEVPHGETGEICVRGTSLAHGYYRNPEATGAAFRQNPRNAAYPEMIYHTGDYGRYNDKGQLMFAARRDWQIKHMGHRIELTEIESKVNAMPQIERCCCQYDEKRSKIVLIYQAEKACDTQILKDLQIYLPKYMCPNRLIWMKKMPVNQRGKTDRVFLKQRFTDADGQMIYKEAIVLGTGTLAFQCAQLLTDRGVHCEICDTGETPSAMLKRTAAAKGLLCRHPSRRELAASLAELRTPTLVVSAINPWILPQEAVDNPYLYMINCHQALLPAHPGRNAEMWAIFEGDEKTGITWHILSGEVDAGNILIQKELPLTDKSTSLQVFREQSALALQAFEEILDGLLTGSCRVREQKGERGTLRHASETPADALLDTSWPFHKISAFLRAYDYGGLTVTDRRPAFAWEGARYTYGNYKICQEADTPPEQTKTCGIQNGSFVIQWEGGSIELQKITRQ